MQISYWLLTAANSFFRLSTSTHFEANWSLYFLFVMTDSSIASLYLQRKASSFACVPRSLILSLAISLLFVTPSCHKKKDVFTGATMFLLIHPAQTI
ncbi:hypothetical protein VIGAN_03230600 [Vigna angularis var. angularis]|uniref:Uncharacterized protein n=1 Tax=Vigna angularis var. angularis TaxID=157739 RepID=A0A0S3RNY5_PHAAN|nr:hypothetical protein VIGAN_03230600 [Vigna angularis var. angularis]